MKKKLTILILAGIAIAAGYAGFTKYEQHRIVESITPHIKNVSLRLTNDLYVWTKETKITYKELFEKLESDIAEIDKQIVDVQTIATATNMKITDSAVAYLRVSQELLRSLLFRDRKSLDLKSATTRVDRTREDRQRNVPIDRINDSFQDTEKAINDLLNAQKEYDKANLDSLNAINNLIEAHAKLDGRIPSDAVADPAILESLARVLKALTE